MTNPSSTTRSSMFIKWSCPLSHGCRFSCRRSARLERVCIARFAISLIGQVSPRCSTPLKVTAKRQGKQRAKFFDDARGSAVECAACLDALVARKLATIERVFEGKRLLFRTVGMLRSWSSASIPIVLAKMRSRGTTTITRTNKQGELDRSSHVRVHYPNRTKVQYRVQGMTPKVGIL